MVHNKEYIIVKANILYRLNPLALYIVQLVLLITETMFISFFIHKIRQAYYSTKEYIKECKENKPIYPFLSVNKVILLLLITIEFPLFISLILCLFNNKQDNFILLNFIIFEVSLHIQIVNLLISLNLSLLILPQSYSLELLSCTYIEPKQ